MELPWKTKGIVLTAPLTEETDKVVELIDKYLAPRGFNTIVLQTRYRYRFKRHPECMGYDPLSEADVKKLLNVCRKNNIRLIPKMNLVGHQSGMPNEPTDGILHGHGQPVKDIRDGLLRAYPEFDEQQNESAVDYSRSICLSNHAARTVVFELIDELLEVFEADAIHIGCDEVFNIGLCPECAKVGKAKLFAEWVNAIDEHVRLKNASLMMWGDRLLPKDTGYNEWESSYNDTEGARDLLNKDITICDWHYFVYDAYRSVDIYAKDGFKMLLSPWFDKDALTKFVNYAKAHDEGHIEGLLMTTWCGSGDLADRLLYGEKGRWVHTDKIAETIDDLL